MEEDQKKLLRAVEERVSLEVEKVERAVKSLQPRFSKPSPDDFWASTYAWAHDDTLDEPPYIPDSRKRDSWLRKIWMREPHLAGVLNSSTMIDANRGFSIIGGRNQVKRFVDVCHNLENGKGWRFYHRKGAKSFRYADIGFVSEKGRNGSNGPITTLWTVDGARCKLTGDINYPLRYYPNRGKSQEWKYNEYFRISSMPSDDETYNDLGYCAVSRAIEIAKTMIAVYEHDHEQLGARAPRGLLILKNIAQSTWDTAMESREAKLDSIEHLYYGGIAVLASAGFDDIDAKLIALSNLPRDFDRKVFTDLLMYAYALVFGYDPEEFWPVSGGSLGRGRETEVQHAKASTKGTLDYCNEFQESFQRMLPDTVQFEYDQRDDLGELQAVEVQQAKANLIKIIYETGAQLGYPLLQPWQAMYLLAENNLIPQEWTETEENVVADDSTPGGDEEARSRYSKYEAVQRSLYSHPEEEIIQYQWKAGRSYERVLFSSMKDYSRYNYRPRYRGKNHLRQSSENKDIEIYYEDPASGVMITSEDVKRALSDGGKNIGDDWLEAVSSEPMTAEEIENNPVE